MPLMWQNGTFSAGVHDEYEEDRQRTECPQDDQALEETNSIQDQVVSHFTTQRLTTTRNARRKQLGNLHKTHQHSKREERVTTLTLQPKKETSEEVTVSKDDLVSVMKRISTSLQEQDSATAPGSGDSMGFSFTAADEHILSASTEETVKMTMVVDSGASDHYVDGKLVKGIKQLMFDYQEFDTPRTITTSELHTLLGLPQGSYGARSPTATAGQECRLYPPQ